MGCCRRRVLHNSTAHAGNVRCSELTRVRCALARRQARVRRLMKEEPDIKAVTQEASLLVSKAVELFVEALTAQALACSPVPDSIIRVGLAYTDVGAR